MDPSTALSSPSVPVELRIGLPPGPPPPNKVRVGDIYPQSHPKPHHLILPAELTGAFYQVVQHLPQSTLALSPFSISAVDGSILCQSESFDSQHSLDASMAALLMTLPLHTPMTVRGRAEGFNHRHGLFEAVHISFCITLSEAIESPITQLATESGATDSPLATASVTAAETRESSHLHEPALELLKMLRSVQVSDESVHLTTSFRVLPDLTLPLSARLGVTDGWKKDIAERMCPDEVSRGAVMMVFEMVNDSSHPLPQTWLDLSAVLRHHRQRVLAGGDDGCNEPPSQEQHRPFSVFPAFLSHCPTPQLTSFTLICAPMSHWQAWFQVEVQSHTDMQLRGFHLVRPLLRFHLHSRACGVSSSEITGQVQATFTVAGSEVPVACCTDVIIDGDLPHPFLTVTGDCLSVMRMADILTANMAPPPDTTLSSASTSIATSPPPLSAPSSPQPLPLSSHTALPWTLEAMLSRQLPWLVPSVPPVMPPEGEMKAEQIAAFNKDWNRVRCAYDFHAHHVVAVTYHSLTLLLVDPSSESSPLSAVPAVSVLLHS